MCRSPGNVGFMLMIVAGIVLSIGGMVIDDVCGETNSMVRRKRTRIRRTTVADQSTARLTARMFTR
jgi:hypothetical protein